jgi:nucleotide-binding universal stress UspA family protein
MQRILVPCDFSAPAEEAFSFAVKLALQSKGELHVLHVLDLTFLQGIPSVSTSYMFNPTFLQQTEKEAREKFQKLWEKHAPMTLAVKFKYHLGTVIHEIEKYVREEAIDLVVMGTQGSGGAKWGSNTEKVVRCAHVPVMALRKAPSRPIKHIVFAVYPGNKSKKLIEEVRKLQTFFNAQLHLLHVNTPLLFTPDPTMQEALQHYASASGLTNYTLNIRSDHSVQEGVARFAKEIDADAIAMGTHAWTGLVHAMVGSVTEDVVNQADILTWSCSLE